MDESDTKRILEIKPKVLLAYNDARSKGFEGTLSDYINEKITGHFDEQTIKYFCVFDIKPCPVRIQFKLQPENLLEYCKICWLNPINKQKPKVAKTDPLILALEHLPMLLEAYVGLETKEKKQIMEFIKVITDKRIQ